MRAGTLVTGAGGLLGNALRALLPDATFVTSRDCDLSDRRRTEELFAALRPQRVLHLAARVGGVMKNAQSNAELFTENILINTHVLDAAQRHGAKRLISVLSACAFSFEPGKASTPQDLHRGLPFSGNLGYAYAKRALEVQTRILRAQHGCAFSTVTPVTMYGPHDTFDLAGGHVVASLIQKAIAAKSEGRALEVWGTGRAVRQFLFCADAARVMVDMLDRDLGEETLVIAPDEGVTIGRLAEEVAKAVGFRGELVFDASKPEGELRRVLSREAFSAAFPDFAFTPLDEGLRLTVAWFSRRMSETGGLRVG